MKQRYHEKILSNKINYARAKIMILKGISKSQSKNIKFEEYKKCLDGEDYQQECDNYIIKSINHEMVLQKVKKSTLSNFDDKRCYINNIESKPWN